MPPEQDLLIWSIHETAGFDTAWTSLGPGRLAAKGRSAGLLPAPFWVTYRLDTTDGFVTQRMQVEARTGETRASLDLLREERG